MKKYEIKNSVLKAYIENDEAISASIQPDGNHLISLEDVDVIISRIESPAKNTDLADNNCSHSSVPSPNQPITKSPN